MIYDKQRIKTYLKGINSQELLDFSEVCFLKNIQECKLLTQFCSKFELAKLSIWKWENSIIDSRFSTLFWKTALKGKLLLPTLLPTAKSIWLYKLLLCLHINTLLLNPKVVIFLIHSPFMQPGTCISALSIYVKISIANAKEKASNSFNIPSLSSCGKRI